MPRVKANPAILRALVRMYQELIPTATKRELEPIARRTLRGRAGDDGQLAAIYRGELARLEIRRRALEVDQVKIRPLIASELAELADNRAHRRFIAAALRRASQRIRDMQLSPVQRRVLERARDGEDRQVPAADGPIGAMRRWYVPPGYVVPAGGPEHQACRTLANRGLLHRHGVPVSPENPYGLGGYGITAKGRRALSR